MYQGLVGQRFLNDAKLWLSFRCRLTASAQVAVQPLPHFFEILFSLKIPVVEGAGRGSRRLMG